MAPVMPGFFWRGASGPQTSAVNYPTPAEKKLAAFMEGTQTCTCSCHQYTALLGETPPTWAHRPIAVSTGVEDHGLSFQMQTYLCKECAGDTKLGADLGFFDWLSRGAP